MSVPATFKAFEALNLRVEKLGDIINPDDPNSLQNASLALGAILDDLTQMVSDAEESDVFVRSIGDEARGGKHIEDMKSLLMQTQTLKTHIDGTINKTSFRQAAAAKASAPAATSTAPLPDTTAALLEHEREPLNRDEISRLLLLCSRGAALGKISPTQKHYIKREVCLRRGYLRVILKLDSLPVIMEALKAVGGEQ